MENTNKFLTKNRQRQKNLSDILNYIVEKGETTRREIERETGFSWGAVSDSVAELISRGYLCEVMPEKKNVGRTSSQLKLCGDNIASIGIDINITGICARVIGFDLTKKWTKTIPVMASNEEEILDSSLQICEEAIEHCKGKYRVLSLGVAIQGRVDAECGISEHFPGFPEWQPVNIKELFEEKFGIFTVVEHDPKCLLFAKCAGWKMRDAMLLRLDNGIGLSVIQDGRILNDFGRMEIGHTVAVKDGDLCACGRRGCLEAYSAIPGVERRKGKKISELLSKSDYSEACYHLALAVYNVSMLFAPQKIILTGALAECEPYVLCLKDELSSYDCFESEIEVDNNISAAFGAALLSIKKAIKTNII